MDGVHKCLTFEKYDSWAHSPAQNPNSSTHLFAPIVSSLLSPPPRLPRPYMCVQRWRGSGGWCPEAVARWGESWALAPGHHDARIPPETLRGQQDPHPPGCALPVYLHLHQDLGKVGTCWGDWPGPLLGVSTHELSPSLGQAPGRREGVGRVGEHGQRVSGGKGGGRASPAPAKASLATPRAGRVTDCTGLGSSPEIDHDQQ